MPKRVLKKSWLSFKVLARMLVAGMVLLGAVIWLWSKFWLFPDIERYREDITAIASQVANQPITIGKIQADWHGIRPRLIFSDVRMLDSEGHTTLSFQRIENVLSWRSLITRQVRLRSLEIQSPDLHIRRDLQGKIHVANFSLENKASEQAANSNVLDMILHQSRIVVSDARITWEDEFNAAPTLLFKQVHLLVDNDGPRHRFAVHAQPPAQLSTNLDIRGDFYGDSFADPKAWHGQVYTQLNYANIPAWKPWLPTAGVLKRGRGAVRGWMDVREGQVFRMTVDVALSDIRTQLVNDALSPEVLTMRGRLVWENVSNGFEVALRKFSLKLNNGLDLQPVDFYLRLAQATGTQPASGEVRAESLELLGLVSLASFLPANSDFRQQLVNFSPSGQVTKLQAKWGGDFNQLQHLDIQARFDNLTWRSVGVIPGFSGLSGQISGNKDAGTLMLSSKNLKLDAPQIMPEPLQFDSLTAKTGWHKNNQGYAIQYENVIVENQDAAGIISGSFQTLADSPGEIDLKVNLTRALVQRTSRYIPLVALKSAGNAWVKQALLDGQSNDFSLILRGNLKQFPFDEKDSGLFQIKASAIGAAVKYHPDWPAIDQGTAQFTIQGRRLETFVSTAMTVGGHLQNVSVAMPDITNPKLMVQIRGEARGKTSHFLDFIQQSPVRGYINEVSDHISAQGNGKLILSLDIPLPGRVANSSNKGLPAPTDTAVAGAPTTIMSAATQIIASAPVKVAGDYHFIENDVTLPDGIVVQQVSGHLLFTESSLHTKNVAGQVFGGPAAVVLKRKPGKPLIVKAQGVAHMDQLRHGVSYPVLNYLHGSIPWQADITIQPKHITVQGTSNLLGIQFDLPVPFTKQASEQIPLTFEMRRKVGRETLSLQYGKLLNAKLVRRKKKGEWLVHGGNIHFGTLPEQGSSAGVIQPGIWMTGTVPELAVQGWGKLLETTNGDGILSSLKFKGADLLIKKISGLGYAMNDVHIKASTPGKTILAKVAASQINGEAKWQPQGKGRLTVRLTSLNLQKSPDLPGGQPARPMAETPPDRASEQLVAGGTQGDPSMLAITGKQTFPTFDLAVDNLTWNKISWGKLELLLNKQVNQPEQIWLAERIHVTTPEGVMAGDGKWIITPNNQQTQVNIGLDILNSGRLLSRLGYPDSVKDGAGRLEGKFYWQGGPQAFGVAVLDGALKLNIGKGQFLQVDPGIGKLLSVFSLQALPKRITLDFTDVFSKGFKFDQISSTAQIRQGLMQIDDFKIEGSAAKVTMHGQVDLIQETQDLRVRILPTISDTVSLLGLAAGPAVGMGVLLANKIFSNPLDKLVSFEYNVDGTWAAPNIVKLGSQDAGGNDDTWMSPSPARTKPMKIEPTAPLEKVIPK
ncbi:MAG: AsmA-like C-terminal region-containing protein [Candidatus Nitrotoga sp.]